MVPHDTEPVSFVGIGTSTKTVHLRPAETPHGRRSELTPPFLFPARLTGTRRPWGGGLHPSGTRGKLTGMLRRGPNRTVGSRFSWASVLLVAVSLLASACSSASATPAKNQPDGAMLDRALHAWTRFPVGSSPRPLILLEGFVLNPEYGFRDDNSKEAFINGEVTPPASWPVSPTSSMGFPIIGAASAFKTLTTPTTNSLGTPLPLGTTAVQLGSGLFLTDRGWRVLPAWLFSLTGVQNPAKVLAVGPSAIYSAPVTRGGDSPAADISSGWRWRSAHRGERRGCGCWHRALHRQLRALGQRVEAGSRRGCGLAPARTDRDPEAPATDLRGVFIGGVSAACVSRTGGSARRAGGGRCQI